MIQQVSDINAYRYLGYNLNASGILRPSLSNLPIWLSRVEKAPLKPSQKFKIIKTYVAPKLFYLLHNPQTTAQALKGVDRLFKTTIKKILHLNTHTPDAAIYGKTRDGGLGFHQAAFPNPVRIEKAHP